MRGYLPVEAADDRLFTYKRGCLPVEVAVGRTMLLILNLSLSLQSRELDRYIEN